MIALVILFSIIVVAATQQGGPSWGAQYTMSFDLANVNEDVITNSVTAQSPNINSLVSHTSSPTGNYTYLVRGDEGKIFLISPSQGKVYCKAYPSGYPPGKYPLGNLTLAPFKLTNQVMLQGKLASHYRIQSGNNFIGAYVAVATGDLLMISNPQNMEQQQHLTSFSTAEPDIALFAIPDACISASSTLLLESEGLGATIHVPTIPEMHTVLENGQLDSMTNSGHNFIEYDVSDFRKQEAPPDVLSTKLATSVDHSNFATPVRDQGSCGSCWTFSTLASIEVNLAVAGFSFDTNNGWLAPQFLLDCTNPYATLNGKPSPIPLRGCHGGWPATAMEFIQSNGVMLESEYHYAAVNQFTCNRQVVSMAEKATGAIFPVKSFKVLPPGSVQDIMDAIASHGSVTAIVQILSDFVNYSGGIYNNPQCTGAKLSHGVTIVGWATDSTGLDYWIVKNSMGRAWGIGGYFYMAKGVNRCGIEANTAVAVIDPEFVISSKSVVPISKR